MRRLLGVVTLILIGLVCAPSAPAQATSVVRTARPSCSSGANPSAIHCFGIWRNTGVLTARTSGYTATDLEHIYHVPAATTGGTGPLVAVIDPYHYGQAATDLAQYRAAYGLPACDPAPDTSACFREVDEHGGASFSPEPPTDNWSGETALDLQMVSAACPSCRLLLVSASSERTLTTAIAQAVAQGAQYVSMSFGGRARHESASFFAGWPDVIFTAASGDDGYQGADWPNEATHVLAIGGLRDAGGQLSTWNDGYGATNAGCARPERSGVTPRMPTPQRADTAIWKTCGNASKAETDLSAIADPRTGVATFVGGRWYEAGGTSAAAPLIAALYADAGNHTDPYAAYVNRGITDVTHGSICNRHVSGRICQAGKGWDGPTGVGMPTSPSALAAAPAAPQLASPGTTRAHLGHHLTHRIALPHTTRGADGTTLPLIALRATVRGLPAGITARVHGIQLVLKGSAKRAGHGEATLYLQGSTSTGRRTEYAAVTLPWRVTGRAR